MPNVHSVPSMLSVRSSRDKGREWCEGVGIGVGVCGVRELCEECMEELVGEGLYRREWIGRV